MRGHQKRPQRLRKKGSFLTQRTFEVHPKTNSFLMSNITLFFQIISKLDRRKFTNLIKEKQTDKHNKGYNSWTNLASMLFSQLCLFDYAIFKTGKGAVKMHTLLALSRKNIMPLSLKLLSSRPSKARLMSWFSDLDQSCYPRRYYL